MRLVLVGTLTALFTASPIGVFAQPTSATDVTKAEIEAVLASMAGGIDRQIKVVDIGDANLAVGILHRDATEGDGSGPVRGLVHSRVTEVYYVLSGGGTLVTGGTVADRRDFAADAQITTVLVGPSYGGMSEGGHSREIAAGDIVVIPAGVFHAWSHIPDHVTYLSIRPDLDKLLPTGYVNPTLDQ